MNADPIVAELSASLTRVTSPAEIRGLLTEIARFPRAHLDARTLASLEARAIVYLRQGTSRDATGAAAAIVNSLLPRCLDLDDEHNGPWPAYTEILGDWLRELPSAVRAEVRNEVLRVATEQLDGGRWSVGLRLIAQVGYASPNICERLAVLASTLPGELGERALGVRYYLGVSDARRAWLLELVHNRLVQGSGYRVLDVAGKVGNRETLAHVLARLEREDENATAGSIDDAIAIQAAVKLVSKEGDPTLASEVWRRIRRAADDHPARQIMRTLNSGVVSNFPTSEVVTDLAATLAGLEGNFRWATYHRLKECVLPAQETGWSGIPSQHLEMVRADALQEVGNIGMSSTSDFMEKEEAWEVLLCVGRADELPSFDQAIQAVASGYAKNRFFELASCLALSTLPGDVRKVFAAAPPDSRWGADEHLVAKVGAVRVAHTCATADGFDALLRDYRPARDGILLSVIEAVAELSLPENCGGSRNRIAHLIEVAEGTADTTARTTARAALARLLEVGELSSEEAERVVGPPAVAGADPYSLRALYHALYDAHEVPIPAALIAEVESLVKGRRSANDREQEAGLPAAAELLYASRLPESDAAAICQAVGLVERDGQTYLVGDSTLNTAYLLARRYRRNPVHASPAVVALLAAGDPFRAAPVLVAIRAAAADNPPEVIQSIVDLAHQMDDGYVAFPDLFSLLAEVAPSRLLGDGWPLLDRWLPQARTALATAIGRLQHLSGSDVAARHELLVRLAGDGMYAVRRATYAAFAACDADAFRLLAFGWAKSDSESGEEPRRRAAEAVAWVSNPHEFNFLGWDVVTEVREAYHQALQQRAERELADYHLTRVLSVTAPEEVLRNWRHGVGLARVGDDRAVQLLKERSQTGLPPNVRYWLGRVRKAVQRRWDEVVRKWPQPMFTRRGRYEVATGAIRREGVGTFPVRVHLWLDPGESPTSLYSWGGWAEPHGSEDELRELVWSEFGPGRGLDTLLITGRSPARILITGMSSQIVFSGNSDYPQAGKSN